MAPKFCGEKLLSLTPWRAGLAFAVAVIVPFIVHCSLIIGGSSVTFDGHDRIL